MSLRRWLNMAVAKAFEWMGWDGWMVNGFLKASSVLKRGRNIPKISPLKLIGAKKRVSCCYEWLQAKASLRREFCAKSTKFAHIKSCLYCQNKTRNSLQHWAYKQGQVCEGGGGVAEFPAVLFYIAHWYLSYYTAGGGNCKRGGIKCFLSISRMRLLACRNARS